MKVFISQPSKNIRERDYKIARNDIIEFILFKYPNAEIIDEQPMDKNPIISLGNSIKSIADADVCYCALGWDRDKKCKFEHDIAISYGKLAIYQNREIVFKIL